MEGFKGCRDDWIRTSGPHVPNVVRYRAALHPERVTNLVISVELSDDYNQLEIPKMVDRIPERAQARGKRKVNVAMQMGA